MLESGQGLVSRRELSSRAVPRSWAGERVKLKELTVVHPQVLAVPGLPMDLMTRFRAALLQMGPNARLSHPSALELYGVLRDHSHETVHVTVPGHVRACKGITAHSGSPTEATVRGGFRVSSIKSAIVEASSEIDIRQLRFPAMQAVQDGLLSATELADLNQVQRRSRKLVRMLGEEALAGAESGGEANFYRLIKDSHLPTPLLQKTVMTFRGERRVDAYWPEYALAAEVDGKEYHARKEDFESDPRRRNSIQAERVVVINFTVSQVMNEHEAVIEDCEANLIARAVDLWVPTPWLRRAGLKTALTHSTT